MRPHIVLGPPGTGKTTRLLGLVEEELRAGTLPGKIGYISFTKRAALEAVGRAVEKFKLERKDFRWFCTIHSLCFQSMGFKTEDVLNGVKLTRDFAHYAKTTIDSKWSEDGTLVGFQPGDRALHIENLARITMTSLRKTYDGMTDDPGVPWHELVRVANCLKSFKEQNGYVDFTDMLEQFILTEMTLGLEVLFVDEAQDLSRLQWTIVKQLARGCRRMVIAGDDDQAIYEWAGADVEQFIGMEGDVEVLGQSWRVPKAVQKVAEKLITKVARRRDKSWKARQDEGRVDRSQRLPDLNGDDVLVLARNNFTLAEMEDELKHRGVLYTINTRLSLAQSSRDAIISWEKLRRGNAVPINDARRVYAKMTTRVGVAYGFKTLKDFDDDAEVTLKDLQERGGLLTDGPWFEALGELTEAEIGYVKTCLQKGESLVKPPRVRLHTIHGAKGGEADHVVLMLEVARRSYENQLKKPDEELRVWYVGVTRARQRLTLVESPTDLRCRWL